MHVVCCEGIRYNSSLQTHGLFRGYFSSKNIQETETIENVPYTCMHQFN
jgi:hypothetical protein